MGKKSFKWFGVYVVGLLLILGSSAVLLFAREPKLWEGICLGLSIILYIISLFKVSLNND